MPREGRRRKGHEAEIRVTRCQSLDIGKGDQLRLVLGHGDLEGQKENCDDQSSAGEEAGTGVERGLAGRTS